MYNPLPGSWFAVAYIEKKEGEEGEEEGSWGEWLARKLTLRKCRYSVGSIALWSRADNVELVLRKGTVGGEGGGEGGQKFRTYRRFHYYKFHVQVGL